MEWKGAEGFDLGLYKKFYDVWVRSTSEMLHEMMQSPQFAEAMGKTLEGSLDFKKQLDELIESSLKNLHLPTTSEVTDLSRRIRALEVQVQDVSKALESLKDHLQTAGQPAEKRPSRKPPKR